MNIGKFMTLYRKLKSSVTNTTGSTMNADEKRSKFAPTRYKGTNTLSPRQREYVAHIFKGDDLQDIAEKMFVTVKAVKFAITELNHKFGTKRRSEMIAKFASSELHPEIMAQIKEITGLQKK